MTYVLLGLLIGAVLFTLRSAGRRIASRRTAAAQLLGDAPRPSLGVDPETGRLHGGF